ncbi:MAG: hypothetical protein PHW07_08825 [Sulfurospirillaceae bacterium]|nr:hypothetical protein [Sulfurospirillaceae bacterium]
MAKINKPTRMCIVCKQRGAQDTLLRLQAQEGELVGFTKIGRSFYLCADCIDKNDKRLIKILNNKCKKNHKSIAEFGIILKEIGTNG